MPYYLTAAPSQLDTDGVRSYTEGELIAVSRAMAASEQTTESRLAALESRATALETPIAFSAHKNNVDQAIGSATVTKITFTTELFDLGGTYDAPNSRWTPPAGIVQISAGLYANGGQVNTIIYKNGTAFRGSFTVLSGSAGPCVSLTDNANGTDYYEIWGFISTTPFTLFGNTIFTWWTGMRRMR